MMRVCSWFIILSCCCISALGRAGAPVLDSISPGVGQRGSSFQTHIYGGHLDQPLEIHFYSQGISCTQLDKRADDEILATFMSAADCPLGTHPFRLRTADGFSEIKLIRITAFPVLEETEPNNNKASAQRVSLNTTVSGAFDPAGKDIFSFEAEEGALITAEVEAVRLGGEFSDAVLTVYTPDGKQLQTIDDTALFHQDPFFSFRAPQSGNYIVEVSEANYSGGASQRYLIHLGRYLRPSAILPVGTSPEKSEVLTYFFDAPIGTHKQNFTAPKSVSFADLPPLEGTTQAPTPNRLRVTPLDNVLESEPNDSLEDIASPMGATPVAFNGVIHSPGDIDHFRFTASEGERIDIEVWASRIGSPIDTLLELLDEWGGMVARNDDATSHDSQLSVTIPRTGVYSLQVRDKRKAGGPYFFYRLELTRPEPFVEIFTPTPARKSQTGQAVNVASGSRSLAFLGVRRHLFDGAVELAWKGLPAGVSATVPVVPTDDYVVPVVLQANANAPLAGSLTEVQGRALSVETSISGSFRQRVPLMPAQGDSFFQVLDVDRLAVAVSRQAPYSIEVVPPAGPLPIHGSCDLLIQAHRTSPMPLEVSFPVLPPGVEAPTSVVMDADVSEMRVPLTIHGWAEPCRGYLVAEVTAASSTRAERDPLLVGMNGLGTMSAAGPDARGGAVCSSLVEVRLATPPFEGRFHSAAAKLGETVRVACRIEPPLPSPFSARLVGLPPRVSAPEVDAPAGATEITFELAVDPTSPEGEFESLICELVGTLGQERVVYRVGARTATLRIDAPTSDRIGPDNKPLSKLEALRRKAAAP
ncbi:PPC domain-containing protein [bacterium]|nr:PPC domain-containing protein [bacterium]